MTITAKNNKEKNTHKENVNRKITGRHYLDIIEERRISVLKLGYLSQMLYALLIEKYIYFFNENKLNSKGEFFQTYDDFKLKLRAGNLSDHLVRKGLDELIKNGFITRNKKFPEGVRNGILKYHYTLNFEKLDNIIITPEEYKLPNKKKYEIQQDIKYAHSTTDKPKTVEITDNTDDKPNAKTVEITDNSDDELIGVGFEDFEDDTIDSTPVIKPDNKTIEPETLSNEDTPIISAVKDETLPNEPDKLIDDDISSNENLKIGNTLEVSIVDKSGNTEHNTRKEDINNNDNTTKQQKIMNVNKTPNEISTEETTDFNERTKLLMKYKDLEGVKPVIEDLRLSFKR